METILIHTNHIEMVGKTAMSVYVKVSGVTVPTENPFQAEAVAIDWNTGKTIGLASWWKGWGKTVKEAFEMVQRYTPEEIEIDIAAGKWIEENPDEIEIPATLRLRHPAL